MKYYLLVLITLLLCACNSSNLRNNEINELKDSIANLEEKIINERASLSKEIDSLSALMKTENSFWFDGYDRKHLQEKGIDDPETTLKENLINNYNFQQDAILGGRMMIDRTKLIGQKWLLAWGSDGHVIVRYIFKYEINDDRSVKWTLLDKEF